MNIVHIFNPNDEALKRYVNLLPTHVDDGGMNYPDILHLHGCWLPYNLRRQTKGHKRIIITPHGQLQPWELQQHKALRISERHLVGKAYAIIAMGTHEAETLRNLGWNERIETIANPAVTKTTTHQRLVNEYLRIYQKVMDSNVYELMNDDTRHALRLLLKIGITGDSHSIGEEQIPQPQWRLLLLYAQSTGVAILLSKGISLAGMQPPSLDIAHIDHYSSVSAAATTTSDNNTIRNTKEGKPITEDEAMAQRILHLIKKMERPTLLQLTELDSTLRHHYIDEERVTVLLSEAGLLQHAARIMQLLAERTAFDEGFMLVPPLNDKQTRQLMND